MTTDPSTSPVRYTARSPHGETVVAFDPDVTVEAHLAMHGHTGRYTLTPAIDDTKVSALEERLSTIKAADTGEEHVVEIAGDDPVVVGWSAEAETEAQAGLRAEIETASHLHYAEAAAALALGAAMPAGDGDADAVEAFQVGLDALGERYTSDDLIDDTGMKLALARSNLANGDAAAARVLFERALEARLQVYAEKFGL